MVVFRDPERSVLRAREHRKRGRPPFALQFDYDASLKLAPIAIKASGFSIVGGVPASSPFTRRRIAARRILPDLVFGSASTMHTRFSAATGGPSGAR